jgi:hypothetical protein
MTTSGLIFMGVSWAAILGLAASCVWLLYQAEGKSGPGGKGSRDHAESGNVKFRKGAIG